MALPDTAVQDRGDDTAAQASASGSNGFDASGQVVRIVPSDGWRAIDLTEFWRYRGLLLFLTLRDIQLRYKQTALGIAWAVLQPAATMLVFTLFFGKLANLEQKTDGRPYSLFVLAALVPWQLFAYALTQSSNSLVAEQRLITKVYFPRLIVPVASVLSGLVDFAITLAFLVGMLLWYGQPLGPSLFAVPLLAIFAVLTALSVGLWLATLNVQYRDVRYTLPFLLQFWMFVSPVAYPSSLVPPEYRTLYGLNPMAGVVEGFRWALLGTATPAWGMIGVSAAVVAAMLAGGLFYFRRLEKTFADVI